MTERATAERLLAAPVAPRSIVLAPTAPTTATPPVDDSARGASTARPGPGGDLVGALAVGVVLTVASYVVGVAAGWVAAEHVGLLEPIAVFTSYACTYLCVKQRRLNYPIGIVSSAAYALLFARADLAASAALNAYLVPTLVYGWVRWRRDADTRAVTRVALRWVPAYGAVTAAGYVGAALLSERVGGALAWTDAVILAGTILAQGLLDNKKLETWAVWAAVNVFAIYTYATSGLPLVAFQYGFFLANTAYGHVTWSRSRGRARA